MVKRMSRSPECIKCGDYIHHGKVICENCLKKYLSTVKTKDLVDEISKREGVTNYKIPIDSEGVINEYVPSGFMGMDKSPKNLEWGIYGPSIIFVVRE